MSETRQAYNVTTDKIYSPPLGHQVEIIVCTDDIRDKFKRGWVGDITVGELGNLETYRVRCKSKYRLKGGDTRLRFAEIVNEESRALGMIDSQHKP